MILTLFDCAKALTTEESDIQVKIDNIKTALRQFGYPDLAFKEVEKNMQEEKTKKRKKDERKKNAESSSGRLLVLLYVKGLSETTARIMKKYERTCAFKPGNTLGQHLFRLKGQGRLNEDGRCDRQGPVQRLPWLLYPRNHKTAGCEDERAPC